MIEFNYLFSWTFGAENLSSPWKTIVILFLLLVGLGLLIGGGDWFVDASVWLAEKFSIPKIIIGATVVSLATTLPEFIVSTIATVQGSLGLISLKDSVDLATGNVYGDILCDTGLILSLSMLFRPMEVSRKTFLVKPLLLLIAIGTFWLLSPDGVFQYYDGLIMILIFLAFFADNLIEAKKQMKEEASLTEKTNASRKDGDEALKNQEGNSSESEGKKQHGTAYNAMLLVFGAAAIILGAFLLVDNGSEFAHEMGVSDKIIAITILAVGTSFPEFVTAVITIIKKQSDISVGNIIGANLIDQTLILSVSSFIYKSGLPVLQSTLVLDMPFALVITAVAVIPTLITQKLRRWQGIICLGLYVAYIALYAIYFAA